MRISLHLIAKDEIEQVTILCDMAKPYFDGIFVTVSDKDAYKTLKKALTGVAEVDFRAWNDKFDEARQHNWELGKDYDASMWLDADDTFDFKRIPELLDNLNQYDVVFLPYHYDHDENGNVIVALWRERILSRRKPFYWKGWVHENLICQEHFTKINIYEPVIHSQDQNHKDSSLKRNHEILLKACKETDDPRYFHYLGVSYFTLKEFQNAIDVLTEYIKTSGWDEEIYRSILKISESYYLLGDVDKAVLEALKAMAILPNYPAAYHLLCHYESTVENNREAIEWGQMALSKTQPIRASIYDPTANDRTSLTIATCHFALGEYEKAFNLLKKVQTINTDEVYDIFKTRAEMSLAAKLIPGLYQFYEYPSILWENLTDDIKYLPEFRKIREQLTKPRTWPKKSIVFFCGKGYEEWGPHTLDKGMGGSEEAVVYLSRELAKLGYNVTVYGEVSEPYDNKGVSWLPWSFIDRRDTFDTLVVWRAPQFASQFKANKILVDMHDLLPEGDVRPYKDVIYMFKSEFHQKRYPKVENFNIIGNGIETSQFKPTKKKPYSVIYPSAYYRGLEQLLKFWPKVKEQVPEATLDIFYGWDSWVALEGEDDFYKRMTKKLKEMEALGVKEHGRVDHETLAKKFEESKVWAYPTEFPEVHCITALKANMAGCKPVITDVAALKETGGPSASVVETDKIYSDEYSQEVFVEELISALKEEHDPKEQIKWAKQSDWKNVAKEWSGVIDA